MFGGSEFPKMPELWKPLPFQVEEATTANLNFVCVPPVSGFLGSPGPPAGASAFGFRWTVPLGATERMSSSALVAPKVIEWGPIRYQVTEPPTGILTVLGPNSEIEPTIAGLGVPEPARTTLEPGSVTGIGGLPWR